MAEQDFLGFSCFSLSCSLRFWHLSLPQHVVSQALCWGWKTQELAQRVQTGQPTPHSQCMSWCPTFRRFTEKALALGDWSGLTSPALGEGSQVLPTCMVTYSMQSGTLAGPCMVSKCMILLLPFGRLHAGHWLLE